MMIFVFGGYVFLVGIENKAYLCKRLHTNIYFNYKFYDFSKFAK